MPNFSDRVHRIADEGSSAWDIHYAALAAVQTDPDVIVLSVGDPDFSTPSHIVQLKLPYSLISESEADNKAGEK